MVVFLPEDLNPAVQESVFLLQALSRAWLPLSQLVLPLLSVKLHLKRSHLCVLLLPLLKCLTEDLLALFVHLWLNQHLNHNHLHNNNHNNNHKLLVRQWDNLPPAQQERCYPAWEVRDLLVQVWLLQVAVLLCPVWVVPLPAVALLCLNHP